ncbi:hypothetical protein DFH11DRAFT_42931 [Phellopilus nigrolimitatus]|nr:hypothetical protein DFH11DRAFT_42931 [Phellopilus nigrolimitatus]
MPFFTPAGSGGICVLVGIAFLCLSGVVPKSPFSARDYSLSVHNGALGAIECYSSTHDVRRDEIVLTLRCLALAQAALTKWRQVLLVSSASFLLPCLHSLSCFLLVPENSE